MTPVIPKVDWVPPGQDGPWTVDRFSVSKGESELSRFRAITHGGRGYVPEGQYTRLTHQGTVVMSDTPAELNDHLAPVTMAQGQVLVAGLGLGIVTNAMLLKPEVEHVLVIEKSGTVINLCGKSLEDKWGRARLSIWHADIFDFTPQSKLSWDVAWFDIWPDLCGDYVCDMSRLKRKFARRVRVWKGCWCEQEMRYHQLRW